MKKIILAVFCSVTLTGCVDRVNTTDLTQSMTKQEVIERLGKPVSATMHDGVQQLIYNIHDHAFGRDKNLYAIGFKDNLLTSVTPLPENMQEESGGLIDRALRIRINSNQSSELGITPNAYGPGIHMDQYGRPVQIVPQ